MIGHAKQTSGIGPIGTVHSVLPIQTPIHGQSLVEPPKKPQTHYVHEEQWFPSLVSRHVGVRIPQPQQPVGVKITTPPKPLSEVFKTSKSVPDHTVPGHSTILVKTTSNNKPPGQFKALWGTRRKRKKTELPVIHG
jgi:hypothetical protein